MDSKTTNREYYKTYWNDNMIKYLSMSAGSRWFEYLLGLVLKEIPGEQVADVADIGCGLGLKTAEMANYFTKAKITGFDFSEAGIQAATKYHTAKNLKFATEDITKSRYKKKYDLITAFDVLEHIDDWQDLTKKLAQVNTRYMLLSSPVGRMRPYEVNIGHVRNFRKREIENFMESLGYKTTKAYYAGFPFYSPILRNLTNAFYRDYSELPQVEMGFVSRRMHDVWYFLFRYCSLKHRGDIFVGLFEKKTPETRKDT